METEEIEKNLKSAAENISVQEIFHKENIGSRAIWSTISELLFLLTPIVLIALILTIKGNLTAINFFGLSDLSLLSTFVFGQAAIKGFQFPRDTFILNGAEAISGIVSLIVCLGVLPSAILFAYSFGVSEKNTFILWAHPIWLVASIVVYAWFSFITSAANIIKYEVTKTIVSDALESKEKT